MNRKPLTAKQLRDLHAATSAEAATTDYPARKRHRTLTPGLAAMAESACRYSPEEEAAALDREANLADPFEPR